MNVKNFATALCFYLISQLSSAQINEDVQTIIDEEIKKNEIPGLAVAVIKSGNINHLSANGFRDLESQSPATLDTPFHVASIAKPIIGVLILKLVEEEKIDLNADVNQYLPFQIFNPYITDDTITISELLNHLSGVRDDYEFYRDWWSVPQGDPETDLEDYLREYLTNEGKNYKKDHFKTNRRREYSNTGFALLGLVIEKISGKSLSEYSKQVIFDPLEMTNTGWFLKDFEVDSVAKTYAMEKSGEYVFKGFNGYPDYPAGQLRTSISSYAKFIVSLLNFETKQVLNRDTVFQMMPPVFSAQEGYYVWQVRMFDNRVYYFHSGGDVGVKAYVVADVIRRNAVVLLQNSEHDMAILLNRIEELMFSDM